MKIKYSILAAIALTAAFALSAQASNTYSNAVMTLNPVGYWPLTDSASPPGAVTPVTANTGSLGAAQNATPAGDIIFGYPGAIVGENDSADSFNGFINAATPAPYSSDVSSAPSFTIEAWLLSHDDGTFWGTTCPLSDVDPNSPRSGWLIYANISNNGQYTFRTYAQNGTSASLSLDLGAPHSIQLENWYHVAVVVSNAVTVTNVYGYINGVLVAGPTPLPGYVPNDGGQGGFTIGSRTDVANGYTCVGAIDEVAYYTNALDGTTILSHYQNGTNSARAIAYSTLIQQQNPVLYYRMDEAPVGQPYPAALPIANNLGSFGASANAYYQPGVTPGVAGPTNSGFGPVSLACQFGSAQTGQTGPGAYCDPYNQTLLNLSPALSVTAWILVPNPIFSFQTPIGRGDTSYRLDVDSGGIPHFAANPNGDVVGPNSLADNNWHFWAGVFDPVTSESYLYIDGALVAQAPGGTPQNMTCYLFFGGAPDYTGRNFIGEMCQVAVFTNALSASQIAGLYGAAGVPPVIALPTNAVSVNAGANLSFPAGVAGTTPINLQWYYVNTLGITNLAAGQTTATLSLTNVASSQDQYQYFLVASNIYGTTISSEMTLSVVQGPPTIQVDLLPSSEQVPVGATVTYTIAATGTLPFHYLWYRDSSLISGATNSIYQFPALSGSHTYSCTITNNFGPANSAVVTLVGLSTPPPVVTFNTNGTGWTINNANSANAGIVNGTLLLTDGTNGEVASAFYNIPQYNGGFAAFFTYQEANGSAPLADGTTFCVQNSANGASAVGGGGGELGYTGIGNSSAFEMNIYNGAHGAIGIQFGTNGMTPDSPTPTLPYFSTSPVNLVSGDPINVEIYFSQGIYFVKLTDATNGSTYSTTYNQGSMASVTGADNAYVGFTGATGGLNSIQTVSNFRFSYTTLPILSVAPSGGNVVLTWPVSVASFFELQQSPSVVGPWTNVVTAPIVVGLQNQVTLPASGGAQFYRLSLQ